MLIAAIGVFLMGHAVFGVMEAIAKVVHADDDFDTSRFECAQQAVKETDKCITTYFDETDAGACTVLLDVECLRDRAVAKYMCKQSAQAECVLGTVYDEEAEKCITETDHLCVAQNKVTSLANWLGLRGRD